LLSLIVLPGAAFGWGGTGHEVVCEIAFKELSGTARREVARLIRLDSEYKTFSASCNWPDRPRRREQEHYINVTRSHAAITADDCPLADVCLFPAIKQDIAVLAGELSNDREKLESLKYLGHWIGDIHQPLHVSHQDDRGANSIDAVGNCEGNLHGAWDYCIIASGLGDDSRTIAKSLRSNIADSDREAWMFDSPIEWANESYQITTSPDMDYCYVRGGACWYTADNMMLSGGEAFRTIHIDQEYLDRHLQTVELRLKQAGVRLAAVINDALRKARPDEAASK